MCRRARPPRTGRTTLGAAGYAKGLKEAAREKPHQLNCVMDHTGSSLLRHPLLQQPLRAQEMPALVVAQAKRSLIPQTGPVQPRAVERYSAPGSILDYALSAWRRAVPTGPQIVQSKRRAGAAGRLRKALLELHVRGWETEEEEDVSERREAARRSTSQDRRQISPAKNPGSCRARGGLRPTRTQASRRGRDADPK